MNKFQPFDPNQAPLPITGDRAPMAMEWHSLKVSIQMISRYAGLKKKPIGRGQKVVLIPGWKTHESSMFLIKSFLSKIGFSVSYWGLGTNKGKVEHYRDVLINRFTTLDQAEPVILIGWSLGGLVAREVARKIPSKISSIITLGTPVIGGPKFTIGANTWGAEETERIIALLDHMNTTNPIQVPITAIFTKKDSFVAWTACIDRISSDVVHHEVQSTHLSLGFDPAVFNLIYDHMNRIHSH